MHAAAVLAALAFAGGGPAPAQVITAGAEAVDMTADSYRVAGSFEGCWRTSRRRYACRGRYDFGPIPCTIRYIMRPERVYVNASLTKWYVSPTRWEPLDAIPSRYCPPS